MVAGAWRNDRRHNRFLHIFTNGESLLGTSPLYTDGHPAARLQHKLARRAAVIADPYLLLPPWKHHLAISQAAAHHWKPTRCESCCCRWPSLHAGHMGTRGGCYWC